jgi:aconitate hydratase
MGQTLTAKILADHLVDGRLEPGAEIGIAIDQTIAHDLTGTMAWLQFEALGLDEGQAEGAGQHCDHQTYQPDFRVADDHRFLRSAAGTYGVYFARPGTGILHQVHKERFTAPGKTLLGDDSHTPTAGGLGCLGIGTGGLDVATAMGGAPYYLEVQGRQRPARG